MEQILPVYCFCVEYGRSVSGVTSYITYVWKSGDSWSLWMWADNSRLMARSTQLSHTANIQRLSLK